MCVSGVEVGTPTHFNIYTKGAGKAKPEVHFAASGPGEAVRDFEIIDNHDYSYTVKYTALQQVQRTSARCPVRLEKELFTVVPCIIKYSFFFWCFLNFFIYFLGQHDNIRDSRRRSHSQEPFPHHSVASYGYWKSESGGIRYQ